MLNNSWKGQPEIHETDNDWTDITIGDDSIPLMTKTAPQIEEKLVRNENMNELHLPFSSTMVLKRKKEMLYIPLDFKNNLMIDVLVDSGAHASAIADNQLDRIKQQAPPTPLKLMTLQIFKDRLQMVNEKTFSNRCTRIWF